MIETYTNPSTIAGIQRLAKKLRAEHGISYTVALDRAAGIAQFENYKHAIRQMGSSAMENGWSIPLYVTAYWMEPKTGNSGRETLKVLLPRPWAKVLTGREFHYLRKLRGLKRAADDHLQFDYVHSSQDSAHDSLRTAARVFLFVAATGLRPATSDKGYSTMLPDNAGKFPGADHETIWREGLSQRYVLVDEPYAMAVEDKSEAREAWALRNGFLMIRSAWSGIHAPGGTALYLLATADRRSELMSIEAGLAKLPVEENDISWTGESAAYRPLWRSPAQQASARSDTVRAPLNPLLGSLRRNNSIGYGGLLVRRGARRPDGRMPVETHQEAGRLLKSVLALTWKRVGARSRVNSVRSRLDDWVQNEYSRQELSNDVFFDLYYHGEPSDFGREPSATEKAEGIQQLRRVAELMRRHYPDSAPLREMLGKLAYAEQSLTSWKNRRLA